MEKGQACPSARPECEAVCEDGEVMEFEGTDYTDFFGRSPQQHVTDYTDFMSLCFHSRSD